MERLGLRTALVSAGALLALASVPAAFAASDAGPSPAPAASPASAGARAAAPGPRVAARHVPGEVIIGYAGGGSRIVDVPAGTPVRAAARALRRSPEVRFAAPNWIARASSVPLDQGTSGTAGGWAADQWNLGPRPGGIRAQGAWDALEARGHPGGAGVTVAVVDTGVSISPDLDASRIVAGADFVDGDSAPLDANGHGTFVASTIAEQPTLGQPSITPDSLVGVAPGVSLMPVRVLDADGAGSADAVTAGISWAARNGADVINLSLNFEPSVTRCRQVPTVCAAIREAERQGSLVVAAAGNAPRTDGGGRALFPAAAPGALAVGASTEHGCAAAYSELGRNVDLLAPGGGEPLAGARQRCRGDVAPILQLTLACFPESCQGRRAEFAIRPQVGTSMAAAHASGVAVLALARRPRLAAGALADRLRCTSRGRRAGLGLLDAPRAVRARHPCARREG